MNHETARQILDLARWAPSGDNTQPWRFEVRSADHIVVHAFDTRRYCLYDFDGQASQLSVGALLETVRIAASAVGRVARIARRDGDDEFPVFDVRLQPAEAGAAADPLHAAIRARAVQRKPLSTRRLGAKDKASLADALGPKHRVLWFETGAERLRWAWLAARSAKIRLTIPEAYAVHRDVIAWGARFSEDRIPDQALGASGLSLRSMRWALTSWRRVRRMNRYLGGTLAPRLELDLIPGLRCGAHFAIVSAHEPAGIDDQVAAGAAVQRFWLTATRLGLQLQPQYTPLVFAAYARRNVAFTADRAAMRRANEVRTTLEHLLGAEAAAAAVFLGRIGHGPAATARSLRLPLDRLQWSPEAMAAISQAAARRRDLG
jgi:nitroreductase